MTTTKSKTALVTGGSRGLGRDMAINLAKNGIDVILTYYNNKQKAEEVVAEIESLGQKAAAFKLDTGDVTLFDEFLKTVTLYLKEQNGNPNFDFLINNAGTALYSLFTETTEEQFDSVMNIHFKGVFFLTQKSLPFINDGGRIINISSGLARFSFPGSSAYGSMKGAIEVLTRYLAKELGPRGIAANVVAPGAIETDFGGGRVRDNKEINDNIASLTALGRVGLPEDIGGVVAFLCTEKAKWINGERIELSGGMML
jgi:NAD(P)-dependent dehydrogenase (short-subunit alcohol dehydrogenase family)